MSQAPSGTMAAVLNCQEAIVQRILQEHGLAGVEGWHRRHPDQIGEMLMQETTDHFNRRFQVFYASDRGGADERVLSRQ